MTCTDLNSIRRNLRTASYKGVRFHVDSTSESFGRRIVTHEFPKGEMPLNEDMGQKARTVSIEGYLTGADWMSRRDALVSACSRQGSGMLRHPFYKKFILARCTNLTVNESKDEVGTARFSMELVEDFSIGIPTFGGVLSFFLQGALNSFVGSAIGAFRFTIAANPHGLDYVTSGVLDWADTLNDARLNAILGSDGDILTSAIGGVVRKADDFAGGDFETPFYELFNAFRSAPVDEFNLATALGPVRFIGVDARKATYGGVVRLGVAAKVKATNDLFRRAFGGLWAEAVALRAYPSREAALTARNSIAEWIEAERSVIDHANEEGLLEALDAFAAKLIEAMDSQAANVANTITTNLPRPMSALAVATRLYGDPTRAVEVWQASGSPSPSRVGPTIEVAAR